MKVSFVRLFVDKIAFVYSFKSLSFKFFLLGLLILYSQTIQLMYIKDSLP